MITESLIILLFILTLSYIFNKKIKAMTIRRSINHKNKQRSPNPPSDSLNGHTSQKQTNNLPPTIKINESSEYLRKIGKTDPKTVAALISSVAKANQNE